MYGKNVVNVFAIIQTYLSVDYSHIDDYHSRPRLPGEHERVSINTESMETGTGIELNANLQQACDVVTTAAQDGDGYEIPQLPPSLASNQIKPQDPDSNEKLQAGAENEEIGAENSSGYEAMTPTSTAGRQAAQPGLNT